MYSLLPQENINKLVSEYRARLAVVIAGIVGAAVLISCILLIPAYVYVYVSGSEIAIESESLKKQTEAAGATQLESELTASNTIVKEFAIFEHQILRSEIIKKLGSRIVEGISITSFTITPEVAVGATSANAPAGGTTDANGRTDVFTVQIVGIAATRDSLVSFTENLNNDSMYSAVGLPISNLAKSSAIPFSLSFKATIPYVAPF